MPAPFGPLDRPAAARSAAGGRNGGGVRPEGADRRIGQPPAGSGLCDDAPWRYGLPEPVPLAR